MVWFAFNLPEKPPQTILVQKDPEMYDVDVGEWHITGTSTIAKEQSRSDTPYVVTHERLSSTAYVLSICVGLERNSLFYNQLISVPLNGMDKVFGFSNHLNFTVVS